MLLSFINTYNIIKERYIIFAKSFNSILYTKINSATYIGSIFGVKLYVIYNVHSYQIIHF